MARLFRRLAPAGRESDGLTLIRTELIDLAWLRPTERRLPGTVGLAQACVELAIRGNDLDLATQLVAGLARLLRERFETDEESGDRAYALNWTEQARHMLTRAANQLAAGSGEESFRRRMQALLWDVEFALRAHLEQRHSSVVTNAVPPGDMPSEDLRRIATPLEPFTDRIRRRPPDQGPSRTVHAPGAERPSFENASASETGAASKRELAGVLSYGPDGLTTEELAAALREDEALLKIGFGLEGALTWTVFQKQAGQLEVVAGGDEAEPDSAVKLRHLLKSFEKACITREQSDAAVRRLLDDCARYVPVEKIARVLRPSMHLLVMTDDVLRAVPLSFLLVDGDPERRFFFECVETLRIVASPMVSADMRGRRSSDRG
ncbi:MAG: hypothetical protein QM775_24385 [Pirellulales bacterium]